MAKFKPFMWDANQLWRHVRTPEDLKVVAATYPQYASAKISRGSDPNPGPNDPCPSFGFRTEHSGEMTLGEFLNA